MPPPPPTAAPLPVKRVGKYDLHHQLGQGSFATVRLGVDTGTQEKFAVKIIAKEFIFRKNLEIQVKREVALLQALNHKHIVALRDVLQTAKTVYLVLELVEGGELFTQIREKRRLDEAVARKIFQQIILAIRYCHNQKVAHRDLKPENILLDRNGDVKVNDFGLAKLSEDGTDMFTTKVGSPNYIAPEVIRDPRYNAFNADVWTCGILLFVMISGKHAFQDKNNNREALYRMIQAGEHREFGPEFSDGCKDLVSKLLVVDVEKRYTIEQVLQHPWFRVDFDVAQLGATEVGPVTPLSEANAVTDVQEPASPAPVGKRPDGPTRSIPFARGPVVVAADELCAQLRAHGMQPQPVADADKDVRVFSTFVTAGSKGLATFLIAVEPSPGADESAAVITLRQSRGDESMLDELHSKLVDALVPSTGSRSLDA